MGGSYRLHADRYRRVRDVFQSALALEGEERARFLHGACAGDEKLLGEVEELLERDERDSLVGAGVARAAREFLSEPAPSLPEAIEHYRVLGLLGRGGMGVVYRARQAHPAREVALKLLRPTVLSPSLARRFQREVHVLGRLHHPGIAQIFEAGTTDLGAGPQPWFAMELIEGESLAAWARERSGREKLELVIRICEAVQHAHEEGVVHRDLKPDNVMVESGGRPKVLDFGVARVTDSDVKLTTIWTDVRNLVGTLPYMSPEQAQGESERLDARSDVYALGVVLYELLAGRLPHDLHGKPVAAAARIVAEEDPTPLSWAARAFRGDLETIVGKALEKDPERRYPTARALAEDLRRHLRDEPIRARPPTTWYQLRKLARRNRRLFLATAGAFLALLTGTVVSTVMAVREGHARARAEQVTSFALGVFSPGGDSERVRSTTSLLERATERVEVELADQPDVAAELYYVIGNLYGLLGEYGARADAFERLLELRPPETTEPHEMVAIALSGLANHYDQHRDYRTSAEVYARLSAYHTRALGPDAPEVLSTRLQSIQARGMAGELEWALEEMRALEPATLGQLRVFDAVGIGSTLYRAGYLAEAEALLAPIPPQTGADPGHRFWSLFQLSALRADAGRYDEADRTALDMTELAGRFTEDARSSHLGYCDYMRAHVLHCQGRFAEAEPLTAGAIEALATSHAAVAFAHRERGMALLGLGRLAEAEVALRTYVERQAKLGDGEWYLGQGEALLGRVLLEQGRLEEAEELGRSAVKRLRRSLRPGHYRLANGLEHLAETLLRAGRLDEAEAACREAILIREGCMEADAAPVASASLVLAEVLARRGEVDLASALAEGALRDLRRALRPGHPELGRAHHVLALVLPDEFGVPVREAFLRAAVDLFREALPERHPQTARSMLELGRLLLEEERVAEGRAFVLRAAHVLRGTVDPCDPARLAAEALLTEHVDHEVAARSPTGP